MDSALGAIYGGPGEGFGGPGQGAGKGPSSPVISKWLGDLRSLFDPETVAVVQNDAIERKGLKQLLLEPELLDGLEPDLNMASTLLMLKDQRPWTAGLTRLCPPPPPWTSPTPSAAI